MKLREWREAAGLTQDDMGGLIKVNGRPLSGSAISRYEAENRMPQRDILKQLHKITAGAVTANDFIAEKEHI